MTITIENLHLHTGEQVYNYIRTHLLSMSHRSMADDGITCAYRGVDGAKCAAGILIHDDEYTFTMEGDTWVGLISNDAFNIPECHLDLIYDLQGVHDNKVNWNLDSTGLNARGIAQLDDVAHRYKELPGWNNLPD